MELFVLRCGGRGILFGFLSVGASRRKVHLDMDYLAAPEDFVGLAPMSLLCERLCSIVNPGVGTLDDPSSCAFIGGGAWTERTASDIRWSFREFVSELLQVRMNTVPGCPYCHPPWFGYNSLLVGIPPSRAPPPKVKHKGKGGVVVCFSPMNWTRP